MKWMDASEIEGHLQHHEWRFQACWFVVGGRSLQQWAFERRQGVEIQKGGPFPEQSDFGVNGVPHDSR